MHNSQVRSEITKLKEKGVPFPLRATLARKRYELRCYCIDKFTALRTQGGCGDPQCNCGAETVYGGTLKIKRKRKDNCYGPKRISVKERKFEITLNDCGSVESFDWL